MSRIGETPVSNTLLADDQNQGWVIILDRKSDAQRSERKDVGSEGRRKKESGVEDVTYARCSRLKEMQQGDDERQMDREGTGR